MGVFAGFIGLAQVAQREASAQPAGQPEPPRMVLVELFTSQGCDMCPEAERVLGAIAAKNPRVVPVALHVDYFNDPWKDLFSDKLYSQRQAAYNALYTGPKHPEYGLYYTPMVMVDGIQSANGRDAEGIQAAVRQALARRPHVAIGTKLEPGDDGRSADLRISLTPRSSRLSGRELLVCAVLTDDLVDTAVASGENAKKVLTARFPARATRFEFTRLDGSQEMSFSFRLDRSWSTEKLRIAVFAQDRKTGEVYQSALIPWVSREGEGAHAQARRRSNR
jgi:hypothetical protein